MNKERTPLVMWTIYDHPKDFPDHYVARKFLITGEAIATPEHIAGDTLEAVRVFMIKKGLYCIPRQPEDDPVIVETWL